MTSQVIAYQLLELLFGTHTFHFDCFFEDFNCVLTPIQGFSLASAIGHSLKIVPDVREFAVHFGQFVRDDFQKCILYGNAQ